MKKLMSIMLVLTLFFSFSANAFAKDESEVPPTEEELFQQGLQIVEEANVKIDLEIATAVELAEILKEGYLNEIQIIEDKEILKLQEEKTKLEDAVNSGEYSRSDVNEMNRKIKELDEKMVGISNRLERTIASISQDIEEFMQLVGPEVTPTNEALYAALEELTQNLEKTSKKYISQTDYYVKKLNEVITDCYDVTLAISNEAIAQAKAKGLNAECSWKLVRFGHLWVWIDPIRIVGFY